MPDWQGPIAVRVAEDDPRLFPNLQTTFEPVVYLVRKVPSIDNSASTSSAVLMITKVCSVIKPHDLQAFVLLRIELNSSATVIEPTCCDAQRLVTAGDGEQDLTEITKCLRAILPQLWHAGLLP
jgi:hypothetical protein